MDNKRLLAERRLHSRLGQELARSNPSYYKQLADQLAASGQEATPEAISRAKMSMFSRPDERFQGMLEAEMANEPKPNMKVIEDKRAASMGQDRWQMQEPSEDRMLQMQQEATAREQAAQEAAELAAKEEQYAKAGFAREGVSRGIKIRQALESGGPASNPFNPGAEPVEAPLQSIRKAFGRR